MVTWHLTMKLSTSKCHERDTFRKLLRQTGNSSLSLPKCLALLHVIRACSWKWPDVSAGISARFLKYALVLSRLLYKKSPGAMIGDGDRKSWDAPGPMIWDNFSIFRTNCAILMSYIRDAPRTCCGFSRGCCHVAWSKMVRFASFHSNGRE